METKAYILQLNAESHFHNDLGLDSLDTVEVVMAIEEVSRSAYDTRKANLTVRQEFSIEIPDKEADAIHSGTFRCRVGDIHTDDITVKQAVDYIMAQPDGESQLENPEVARN